MPSNLSHLKPTEQLDKALEQVGIRILKYDTKKARPVVLTTGNVTVEKLLQLLHSKLGVSLLKYRKLCDQIENPKKFESLVRLYAKKNGILKDDPTPKSTEELPDGLTLNLDISCQDRQLKFFVTNQDEVRSYIGGYTYLRMMQLKEEDAIAQARRVVPRYLPRSAQGIVKETLENGESFNIFNDYTPPEWMSYNGHLPDKLPPLFERLVNHLFPIELEREYFYCWLYASLFDRAFVYLILCGPGGTGKNRLKLVLRALHGHLNTVDGKRSTFAERFNSQLSDNTLAWFDELHYNMEMENSMKELQNDSISIEKKGIDATRSTKIYSSCVISNNKPRDNYIAFDARKFVPLQITNVRLDEVMTGEEISSLTDKVETVKKENGYDIEFVAQIGRWIEKHGRKKKWMDKNLEYKGPMFYKLAHTSMSKWQKRIAQVVLSGQFKSNSRVNYDHRKGYLWSTLEEVALKKQMGRGSSFPDFSTIEHFFNIFVDSEGRKAFRTAQVPGDLLGDFWVMPTRKDIHIVSENEVLGPAKAVEDDDEEEYDL